jgi:hypothetical protein
MDQLKNFLTQTSCSKVDIIEIQKLKSHPKLLKLLDNMIIAFQTELKIEPMFTNIDQLKKEFIDFNNSFNRIYDSSFVRDVQNMDFGLSIKLTLKNKNGVELFFLSNNSNHSKKLISPIIHAVNTFCGLFDYNYDGLQIKICLDDNKRDLTNKYQSWEKNIEFLKQHSMAFNTSGVTYRDNKLIYVTRKEEIIKLIFHELVHYIKLDDALTSQYFVSNWSVQHDSLKTYEAYAELVSVLLNSAYLSIHLCTKMNKSDFDNMYLYLLSFEKTYSINLMANILKFYGYDEKTFYNFFNGVSNKISSPVPIWEYVFLRSIMFLNLDDLLNEISQNLKLTPANTVLIMKKLNDNDLGNILLKPFKNNKYLSNVSYSIIDIDWTKI